MSDHFELLPESVQAWFFILMEARERGLPFEEAMASLRGSDAEEGFLEWRAAIGQPLAPYGEGVPSSHRANRL